jgi:hypothetical protein
MLDDEPSGSGAVRDPFVALCSNDVHVHGGGF